MNKIFYISNYQLLIKHIIYLLLFVMRYILIILN